jgi:hypothetical protein
MPRGGVTMMTFLIVGASIYVAVVLGTLAFSGNWLASGIRGTVRQGILGVAFVTPVALVVAAFGVAIYAVVASILYVLDLVK